MQPLSNVNIHETSPSLPGSWPLMSKCQNVYVNCRYHDVKMSVYRILKSVRPCLDDVFESNNVKIEEL